VHIAWGVISRLSDQLLQVKNTLLGTGDRIFIVLGLASSV